MVEGIDAGSYVGALFIGYHSGASDLRGVLAHTLHGGAISEVRLNNRAASETVISAATAAHFGVPTIMVSGDDAYIEHAKSVLPNVEGVVTKYAHSWTSARTLMPSEVQSQISRSVTAALARLDEFSVDALPENIIVDICLLSRKGAELLAYLPMIERQDSHTIRFVGKDMVEVSKILSFLTASGALMPK